MAFETYWITFDLKYDTTNKGTYSERYEALMAALHSVNDGWWAQPTSFIVFGSETSRSAIVQKIKTAIDASTDIVVLGMVGYKVFDCIGAVKDLEALRTMVSFAKKA